MLRVANAMNGLAFPPYDEVSMFLSTHGHNCKFGYFRIDAMPYSAVIELLRGNSICMVDATQHNKPLTDAFKFGLTTWCLVFNRAIRQRVKVASWQTPAIERNANSSKFSPVVQRIRRLMTLYGCTKPAVIGDNVLIEMHRNFEFDDKMYMLGGVNDLS
jgi:hypothetical protein